MTEHVFVPRHNGQRYYDTHYRFFVNLLQAAGVQIGFYNPRRNGRGFIALFNDHKIHIDFGDHSDVAQDVKLYDVCFRYHFRLEDHSHIPRTFPLTPISFYRWDEYQALKDSIHYQCNKNMVLNNQKPGKAAMARRGHVQYLLKDKYRAQADIEITDKIQFWRKINNCLVSVCIPGARNDILDRGQFQYWAFGACTISPRLNIVLPFWTEPKPNTHYLQCAPDYSDLLEKIEWCKEHRDTCIEIGAMAKDLFEATCTPERVWAWIKKCVEDTYDTGRNQSKNNRA